MPPRASWFPSPGFQSTNRVRRRARRFHRRVLQFSRRSVGARTQPHPSPARSRTAVHALAPGPRACRRVERRVYPARGEAPRRLLAPRRALVDRPPRRVWPFLHPFHFERRRCPWPRSVCAMPEVIARATPRRRRALSAAVSCRRASVRPLPAVSRRSRAPRPRPPVDATSRRASTARSTPRRPRRCDASRGPLSISRKLLDRSPEPSRAPASEVRHVWKPSRRMKQPPRRASTRPARTQTL